MQDRDLNEYNPSGSSTSQTISCSHQICELGPNCPNPKLQCPYTVKYYTDDTSTSGFLVEDVFHLVPGISDVSNKSVRAPVIIGCVFCFAHTSVYPKITTEKHFPLLILLLICSSILDAVANKLVGT